MTAGLERADAAVAADRELSEWPDAAAWRLLVVADSDSYVKWGAALASTLPSTWAIRLVILASPVMPSGRHLADALAGTRFASGDVRESPGHPHGARLRPRAGPRRPQQPRPPETT